jgi:aryl carrier-like protein
MATLGGDARREAVNAFVQRAVLTILDLPPDRVLDPEKSLIDLGLDSLLAVELKNAILDGGVDIPVARVMTGPPLSTVVSMVLQSLDEGAGQAIPVGADEDPEPLVPKIGMEFQARRSEGAGGEPAIHPIASHMLAMGFGMILLIVLYVVASQFSVTLEEPAEEGAAEEQVPESPRTKARPRRSRQ